MRNGRRAKPGGEEHPRYFIDSSYCQSGTVWPAAYADAQPPMLATLRERHLAAGGTRPWLYDEAQFFDSERAYTLSQSLEGSVVLDLRQWNGS